MTITQNGTAKSTTQVNGTTTPQAVTPQLPEVKKNIPEKKVLPPIQTRLSKLRDLNKILERREEVAEALENLTDFYIAPTGNACNLKLQDSKNKTFVISNAAIVAEMVELAKGKLQSELNEIDNQFDFAI